MVPWTIADWRFLAAVGGNPFQLAGHAVDVLNDPSDVVDEGDSTTVLDLVLDRPMDLRDVEREESRRDGSTLGEACRRPGRRRS